MIKKNILYLSLFFFCSFAGSLSVSADVACWEECTQGASRAIYADGTTCGAGAATATPLDSEPYCVEYEKPACSPTYFWLCTEPFACLGLGDWYYYADGQCYFYEILPDVDIGGGGSSEDYLRNINMQVVATNSYLKQIANTLWAYLPLGTLFVFFLLLGWLVSLFIKRKF